MYEYSFIYSSVNLCIKVANKYLVFYQLIRNDPLIINNDHIIKSF